MKRSILRPVAVGIATLSTVAGLAIGAVSSQAASVGTLTFTPSSGTDQTPLLVTTSGPCPGGTNLQVNVTGAGFPAAGQNVTPNNDQTIFPTDAVTGGYLVPFSDTMQSFASQQTPPATLSGDYNVSLICKAHLGSGTFGTFDGVVTFSQHAGGSPTFAAKVAAVNYTTTTALASSPASPVDTGVPVAFTVHVGSTPAGGATGTVQLLDGVTPVGSPTAVDASGNAVINTSFATAGSHSVTAAFTGSAANVGNSVSTPIVYTVNQSPATPTTTALSISPASATSADTVTLTATVGPNGAAGHVQFADGGTNVGGAVTVSAGGTATLSQTFSEGQHSFTAAFTPNDAAAFAPSASTSQAYTVSHFAGQQATGNLQTTIAAGSLTISTDPTTVVLPAPALNADATYLVSTGGKINTVTVTDTRAGNPGWVVSGQVSDFTNAGSPTTPINGFNLGWVPTLGTFSLGQTVQLGGTIDPATAPVTADLPATDGHGLKVSRQLAKTDAGHGTGTALLGADLTLNVPTSVLAGTYSATLTLTAI